MCRHYFFAFIKSDFGIWTNIQQHPISSILVPEQGAGFSWSCYKDLTSAVSLGKPVLVWICSTTADSFTAGRSFLDAYWIARPFPQIGQVKWLGCVRLTAAKWSMVESYWASRCSTFSLGGWVPERPGDWRLRDPSCGSMHIKTFLPRLSPLRRATRGRLLGYWLYNAHFIPWMHKPPTQSSSSAHVSHISYH